MCCGAPFKPWSTTAEPGLNGATGSLTAQGSVTRVGKVTFSRRLGDPAGLCDEWMSGAVSRSSRSKSFGDGVTFARHDIMSATSSRNGDVGDDLELHGVPSEMDGEPGTPARGE
jgi:hypothetical protein